MPIPAENSLLDFLEDDDTSNLFVHDATSAGDIASLTRVVPGLASYDQRALALAGPRDLVCLLERPDEAFLDYLERVGLAVDTERIVTPRELGSTVATGSLLDRLLGSPTAVAELSKRLADEPRRIRLQPFIATARELELAGALERAANREIQLLGGDPRGIDRANQKHRGREKARELGIPVAPGEVVELAPGSGDPFADLRPLKAAVARQWTRTGRVIVRGTRGYSASSTHVIEANPRSLERTLEALAKRTDNSIYLVDALLPLRLSPNLQTLIDPDSDAIHCLSVTDQLLGSGLDHRGNALPTRAENASAMWEHALKLSRWLRDEGCTGIVGFDFCEADDPESESSPFFVEINARINGGTYALALFQRLVRRLRREGTPPPEAFVTQIAKTRLRSFEEIGRALGDILLEPGSAAGVLPCHPGSLGTGSIALLAIATDRDSAGALCRRALERIR